MLTDAIKKRFSIRKYDQTPFNEDTLNKVKHIVLNQPPLFKDIKYQVDVVYDGPAFKNVLGGIIGSYGKVHAPHYLVASTETKENAYENMGYLVEYIVLKLTELGIGTCWIGGGIKKNQFADYLSLDTDLTPIAVIAFGYPLDANLCRSVEAKRKSMDEIAFGDYLSHKNTMELVRLAPSAVNIQPWRYDFIDKNQVDLYRAKNNFIMKQFVNEMNRIDLGISICHFEIGVLASHKKIKLVHLNKEKKALIYYQTLIIE